MPLADWLALRPHLLPPCPFVFRRGKGNLPPKASERVRLSIERMETLGTVIFLTLQILQWVDWRATVKQGKEHLIMGNLVKYGTSIKTGQG